MRASDISAEEFGQIFVRNKDKFISIAKSYIRDGVVAEDIVTESFTAFWDSRAHIELKTVPEAYILQSVKNKCLNYLRDSLTKVKVEKQLADKCKLVEAEISILANDDLGFLFRADVIAIFRKVLGDYPEVSRNIFVASRFDGLTYKEIAEKYGVSERKVKRDIVKILGELRIQLGDYLPVLMILLTL